MEKLPCLTLNRHADKRLQERHPWIFSNEISEKERTDRLSSGALIDVVDRHGNYVGCGFYNPHSLIAIRLLSREKNAINDKQFWTQKFYQSIKLRQPVYGAHTAAKNTYRAAFGESDGLPGLIIDRYESVWVMQFHSLGMHLRKNELIQALQEALRLLEDSPAAAIVSRSDARSAKLEGLPEESSLAFGELPKDGVYAWEGPVRFPVDVVDGQKTGFFFDQRENRRIWQNFIQQNANWKKIAGDIFCHLGGWGFAALMAGAEKVIFLDQSEAALSVVTNIAEENGWQKKIECIRADANEQATWERLPNFSALAVDPPAYIQTKKNLNTGLRAYRQLNQKAITKLAPGALLSTSTCSHHCSESEFEDAVAGALAINKKDAQMIFRGFAAYDHPALVGIKESRYLKSLLLRVN